jgi:4-hydroxysphinganine ceramide fatty acyl 2-hydroxylase
MAGLLTGYIVYDMTHYYTHHARPKTRWGKWLKAWHLAHHHKYWTRMYGVSSPIWDLVFRTGRPPKGTK